MAYIYSITNLVNQRQYIGLTRQSNPYDRWKQHLNDSKYHRQHPIHCAIHKYGVDNFKFRIIEECSDDDVEEREIHYIAKYNTYYEGYNATLGGNIRYDKDAKAISCYTKRGEWVEDYSSLKDAADAVNGDMGGISKCANGKRFSAYNYRWCWKGEELPNIQQKYLYPHYGYNKQGEYREWATLNDCAIDLECDRRTISQSVKSSTKNKLQCKGWYIFKKGKRRISFNEIVMAKRRKLTPEEASKIGKIGAKVRWDKVKDSSSF